MAPLPAPVVRRLARTAEVLTLVHPRWGVALAGRIGRLAARGDDRWRVFTVGELEALLGALPPAELLDIRRNVAEQEFRNAALRRLLMARGVGAIEPLVVAVHAEPFLRQRETGVPTIVVGWHLGPSWGRSAALRRLGRPALCGAGRAELPPDASVGPVRHLRSQRDGSATAFLKAALAELEGGGVVALQLDGRRGIPMEFLGHRAMVGRGAGWLARRTGARLVPATGRFVGSWQIEWTFHEPLPEPAVPRDPVGPFERAVLQGAVTFFEAWARAHPELLRVPPFRRLLARST